MLGVWTGFIWVMNIIETKSKKENPTGPIQDFTEEDKWLNPVRRIIAGGQKLSRDRKVL